MAQEKTQGKIGVTTENIFPVIKQFLYSDNDIFIREIVANAVDATQKMKAMASKGAYKRELGDLTIDIAVGEAKLPGEKEGEEITCKTISVTDRGIGMTEEEVDKYINQIAFSSAGEFLAKYKDQNIIGHFGLGFYSSFMVSRKVEIDTLSWRANAKAVKWSCQGNPEYTMERSDRKERGTTVTLYLDAENEGFADRWKLETLLKKYCKFMPVTIRFGKEQEWKDGKYVDGEKDNIINNCEPIWTKKPADLKDEDYDKFYKELYPMQDDPLFHIHLNVDYPFNLTGILYFPKIKDRMDLARNKVQLYCNQMFVTDSVENILPEFMTVLHGVIDSPDIPLNVSRSYLQNDNNVKKISHYITRKVADKLEEISKNNAKEFEEKWDDLKIFIEYGMLTDAKFCEKAMEFALFKNTDGKYFKMADYRKAIEANQTNKDKKVVYLYATDKLAQYQYIENAKNKGYDVLLMDCQLDAHYVGLLEQHIHDSVFTRVDADILEKLIEKEEVKAVEMTDDEKKHLQEEFEKILPEGNKYEVVMQNLGEEADAVSINQNEFMRRYRDMAVVSGGGMNMMGEMPAYFNVTVNADNALIKKIRESEGGISADNELLKQVTDLALLAAGLLKGKSLSDFIRRSASLLK
ncbi:MAG: molecular chaperone HtpG [Bacteroidales bacterium]|nr:molecular chaperone HtpG [Bacteroidales bacterium]